MHPPSSHSMSRSGEAANLLIPHRHGPHDGFFVAPTTQVYEAEPKRKSWGERWKIGKTNKHEETMMEVPPQYMVHPDYVTKYGTISPGILSKSFKYAETWLYGTVNVHTTPPHRPNLFLYPGILGPPPRSVEHHAVVPRFAPVPNGTVSSRNGTVSSRNGTHRSARNICYCRDNQKGNMCGLCGVRRETMRHTSKIRPSLINSTSQEQPKVISNAPDPYNLMRKSRLGVGEQTETSIINPKTKHKRTRSTSPINRFEATPSFETFKPKNEKSWAITSLQEWASDEEDSKNRPKSILECNLSAYDLNKKSESSDDFSDGTSEVNTKLKIIRPKLKKTELKHKKITIPEPKKIPEQEVRLSGQRFRIFNQTSSLKHTNEGGYISDKEDKDGDLPKRPPRRQKQLGLKLSKVRSTSSPNLSIKSILKKPFGDVTEDIIDEMISQELNEDQTMSNATYKKQTQNTLKKKKQVQFRVNGSSENVADMNDMHKSEVNVIDVADITITVPEPTEIIKRSSSCGDLLDEDHTGNELSEYDDRKRLAEDPCDMNADVDPDVEQGPVESVTSLKRSFSDRRPSATVVKYRDEVIELSTSPPNSYLFNDTMALRPRGSRYDTREVFLDNLEDGLKPSLKSRPKEPPPPPPLPNTTPDRKEHKNCSDELAEKRQQILITAGAKTRSDPHRVILDSVPTSPVKLCENCENGIKKPVEEAKTLVTITQVGVPSEDTKKTSIIINGNMSADNDSKSQRTSVIINTFANEPSNKLTINVRNDNEETQSCSTIIETGSQSTVIPVVSKDNRTTLVVGSVIPPVDSPVKPAPYLFSSATLLDNMDPVEAVKRNLVPHVCGKIEPSPPSLIDRLKEDKNTSTSKQPLNCQPVVNNVQNDSLLLTYQARKTSKWKNVDESPATSRSNSFSTKASSRNTSRSNSFNDSSLNSFSPALISRSKFYVPSDSDETVTQELDKLDDEYVIRSVVPLEKKVEEENIYETIKEPIYDELHLKANYEESDEDVPPPLPTTLPPSIEELEHRASKSIFEGASKYDILSYLVDAKDRIQEDNYLIEHRHMESLDGSELSELSVGKSSDSGIDAGPLSNGSDSSEERETSLQNRKGSAEVERNDSGVGSETSQSSRSKWQSNNNALREDVLHLCEDCDQTVETQVTDSGVMYAPLICRKCAKKRVERKEIIQEIVDTEEKYGRDLRIILEEFYKPMLVAGLLTSEQLGTIFLNVEELLENSESLTEKLKDTLEMANEQGDEDLFTVNIGRLFLDAKPMLHAFESYCTRQASAAVLLAGLEKEKELLRIFLRVSQMDNAVLRRMNLNSFLMVPVQRVTKYPLLLARLYKVTPTHHESRDVLKEAQHNIELHLEHMNAEAKDAGTTRVWRRFSTTVNRKSTAELEMTSIKLRKMAVDLLEWSHDEVRFVLEGRLLFTQPTDANWKRGRTVKLQPIFVLLATLGKPNGKYRAESLNGDLTFPCKTGIREATLLLIKEKCGRYTLIREPLYLDKLIICCEADNEEFLEVQELTTKDTFIFKGEDTEKTKEWYKQLQYHAQILGGWRKRRNALANIMITGMSYGA